jgi:hypothetical protein
LEFLERDTRELRAKLEGIQASLDVSVPIFANQAVVAAMEAHSDRVKKSADDLTLLQMEAAELAAKLRTHLLRLDTQKKVLRDLLESGPDLAAFPTGSIKLRVGEHVYHTSVQTLTRDPTSMLAAMFSGKFALHKDEDGCVFIDRDGALFGTVLYFLRTSRLPSDLAATAQADLLAEAEFYGLAQLIALIKEACQPCQVEEHLERSTAENLRSVATANFVQSVIAMLAEVTQLAFRQMAQDADSGLMETVLTFLPVSYRSSLTDIGSGFSFWCCSRAHFCRVISTTTFSWPKTGPPGRRCQFLWSCCGRRVPSVLCRHPVPARSLW